MKLVENSLVPSNYEENPIRRILQMVYPPFALLAGMQLDLFTSLDEGPLTNQQLADKKGVDAKKQKVLLYSY